MNKIYKKNFLQAGVLAKEVRAYGKSLIVKNASYQEVLQKINAKIKELKALPAFPPQIALNHIAAHFLLDPEEDLLFDDQVVKLDVGICYEGAIGDCAVTIDLSGKYQLLIEAVEKALKKAEENIFVGQTMGEVGKMIEDTIQSFGYNPIKNLAGHGLGPYKIHTPPMVPNYNDQSKETIKKGMTFAIEPFASNGNGFITEHGVATIFTLHKEKPTRTPIERYLFNKMKSFKGLPFSLSNLLSKEFSNSEIKQEVKKFVQEGLVYGYAPLIEKENSMVAQAENSVLVDEEGKVFITTR